MITCITGRSGGGKSYAAASMLAEHDGPFLIIEAPAGPSTYLSRDFTVSTFDPRRIGVVEVPLRADLGTIFTRARAGLDALMAASCDAPERRLVVLDAGTHAETVEAFARGLAHADVEVICTIQATDADAPWADRHLVADFGRTVPALSTASA